MLKVQGLFVIGYVYVSKQELRNIKRHLKDQMSFMMNLHVNMHVNVVQCFLIKCKKRQHKYCVSRTKLLTSGDIELKPGPIILREIIQTIVLNCYSLALLPQLSHFLIMSLPYTAF